MFPIYFCADGILRARFQNNPLIPLSFIQEKSNISDNFTFWSSWLNNNTYFEEGLTVSKFLSCLEPWTDFFSTLTHIDIKSYLQEIKKPCSLENRTRLKYIEISAQTILSPELNYLEKISTQELLKEFKPGNKIKSKRLVQLSGLWNSNDRTSIHGLMTGENHRFIFSLAYPERLADTSLYLNHNKIISFNNYAKKFTGEDIQIFNEKLPSVIKNHGERNVLIHKINFSFLSILETFFSELKETPEEGRIFEEKIMALAKKASENYEKSQKETDSIENMQVDKEVNIKEPLPNLKFFISNEQIYWNNLLSLVSDSDKTTLLTSVSEQTMPDIRLFGQIINEEDYIQPSEKKYI